MLVVKLVKSINIGLYATLNRVYSGSVTTPTCFASHLSSRRGFRSDWQRLAIAKQFPQTKSYHSQASLGIPRAVRHIPRNKEKLSLANASFRE